MGIIIILSGLLVCGLSASIEECSDTYLCNEEMSLEDCTKQIEVYDVQEKWVYEFCPVMCGRCDGNPVCEDRYLCSLVTRCDKKFTDNATYVGRGDEFCPRKCGNC